MKIHCRLAAAVLSAAAILGTAVQAQTPAAPGKIYTKRTAFKLPVKIEDKDRAGLDKVQLYVKDGNEPWACKDVAPPTQPDFTYHVQHDGEYWFSVVTVDKNGKTTPSDVTKEAPGLVVVVDTQPPEVDVHPMTVSSGETVLKCNVQDANPDLGKVKLEYQTDAGWITLEPFADQPGLFRVPDPSLKGLVRATATDRAGNVATREMSLAAAKPPMPSDSTAASGPVFETHPVVETHVEKQVGPAMSPTAPTHTNVGANLQLINSNRASLDYQIDDLGPSGIGKIEVWTTRDEGQSWQRLCEDTQHHSPIQLDLPGDGLYGITLVVTNGHGNGGVPPARGDTPNWWVEVDTTKPAAQLLAVRTGSGEDSNAILVSWTASDKNLKPEPVDLYYSAQKDGNWQSIARGIPNTGNYRWVMPKGIGPEIYVRMDVCDRAGNVARCEATQPVVLDSSRPKARVLGISVSTGSSTSPAAN